MMKTNFIRKLRYINSILPIMQYHLLPKNELFGCTGHVNIGLDTLIISIELFSTELWKKIQVAN